MNPSAWRPAPLSTPDSTVLVLYPRTARNTHGIAAAMALMTAWYTQHVAMYVYNSCTQRDAYFEIENLINIKGDCWQDNTH